MDKQLEDFLRIEHRKNMHFIWENVKNGNLHNLDEEEQQLGKIMLEHKDEFYNQFEFSDVLAEWNFDPESEVDPFMHIIIHSIVENQLREKTPIEAYQFYNAMRNKRVDRHEIIHWIAYIMTFFIYRTLKHKEPFEEKNYRKALKYFMNKNPKNIPMALEREMERFCPSK